MDEFITTELHDAAGASNLKQVNRLLDAGAHVNARDEAGQTPAHRATALALDPLPVLARLYASGANFHITDNAGKKPEDYLSERTMEAEHYEQIGVFEHGH